MIESKKVLIKTVDGNIKKIQVNWKTENIEKLQHDFGVNMEREVYAILFHDIVESLMKENIKISNLKSIMFEDMNGGE